MLLKIFYFIQVIFLTINIISTVLFSLINDIINDIYIMLLLYIIYEYINVGLIQLSIFKKNFNSAVKILYSKVISIFIGILIMYKAENICNNTNHNICILLNIISFNTIAIGISIFLVFYYRRKMIRREIQNENLLFFRIIAQPQNIVYESNNSDRIAIPINNNMEIYQYPINIINNAQYQENLGLRIGSFRPDVHTTNLPNATNLPNRTDSNDIICSICLEEKQNLEEWTNLNCNHQYHAKCISEWFKKTDTCPDCRTVIK